MTSVSGRGHGEHWPKPGRQTYKYSDDWLENHRCWAEILTDAATGKQLRCEDFRDFPSRFKPIIDVVRIVSAPKGVDFGDIGMHWSWELQSWHPWKGKPVRPPFVDKLVRRGTLILIRGRVERDKIDWRETAFQNLVYCFSEKELVLRAGASLDVVEVRELSVDPATKALVEGSRINHPSIATVRT